MIKALWFRCRITSHQIRISYFFNFWNSLPSCRSFFRLMVRLQFVSTFHSFKWDYRYDRSTLVRVFQLLRIIFKIDPENWSTLDLMMAFNRVYAIFFSFLSLLEFKKNFLSYPPPPNLLGVVSNSDMMARSILDIAEPSRTWIAHSSRKERHSPATIFLFGKQTKNELCQLTSYSYQYLRHRKTRKKNKKKKKKRDLIETNTLTPDFNDWYIFFINCFNYNSNNFSRHYLDLNQTVMLNFLS